MDDGSDDDTSGIAKGYGVVVLRHDRNMGKGMALRTGFSYALERGYELVMTMDGDGQHDPKYIPDFLKTIKESDMVIGSRFLCDSHRDYHVVRRAGIRFFSRAVNMLTGSKITDITSGYRAYRSETLKRLSPLPNRHWAVEQTMEALRKGLKVKELPVEMPTRSKGKSQFSPKTFIKYPFNMCTVILKVMLFR